MASTSSLIFMAADESTCRDATAAAASSGAGARAFRSEEAKPEGERAATRTRGRKPSNKAANAKKQPQRGLGVAQLERLRQEERNQKIAEMLQLQLHLQPPNFPGPAAAVAGAEPLQSVPVHYGAGGFGAHYRLMAVPQPQHGGGFGVGVGSHYHYGFGSISPPVKNLDQTSSKELSSKPKPQLLVPPYHDQSLDIRTFKKKRYNEENNGGMVMREMGSGNNNLMNFFGGDQLGLGFSPNIPSPHIPQNSEGLEVVAVHRKESNQDSHRVGDEEVVMEYQFFPARKNAAGSILGGGGGGGSKEMLQIMPNSEKLGSGEASSYYYHQANANASAGTSTYGTDTSNHVDLALKL